MSSSGQELQINFNKLQISVECRHIQGLFLLLVMYPQHSCLQVIIPLQYTFLLFLLSVLLLLYEPNIFLLKKNCSFPFFVHLLLHGLTISRLHMLSFSISFSSSLQIKYFPGPYIFHLQSSPPSWRNSPSYSSPFMFFSSDKVHHWV